VPQKSPTPANSRIIVCAMLRHAGMPMMSPYYAGIFEGIEEEVAAHHYEMLFTSIPYTALWTSNQRPRTVPMMPKKNRFQGALLIGGLTDNLAIAYQKKGVSVMLVDKPAAAGRSSVMPDNFNAAAMAARYLIKLGHCRIAFLGAPPDPVVEARHEGFLSALRKAGLSFDKKDYILGSYGTEKSAKAMTDYLKQQKRKLPTAILAINDEAALGVIRALQAQKITVPKKMSVMGFDDIRQAVDSNPPLTTMRIPRMEMGRLAAKTLFAQIADPTISPTSVRLRTDLVIRKSCAKPRSP
jgi:DNA-binding LacI/PurR family transcriptional regulator